MSHSWQQLLNHTKDKIFRIERVRMVESGIAIEGDFTLPPLALLSPENQAFASAFIASHGSIKKMEELFGISYPTVKNRLNRIAETLDVPQVVIRSSEETRRKADVLDRLDRQEISFDDAMEALR